ncbi:hypothetical protein T265_00696 [Opisthorchis viverrini]|uniref:Uncharacterized protein n=1 Tax=Opisthorchis viverrini TaxID=6198 RepID=A0A075A1Y2_OPIVI|nr:hypothetical protein T265_00696 [Opisthorchis viverrini]KER33376.1 hypothetical protein T265_00696 [Opisthorchis viverrini]
MWPLSGSPSRKTAVTSAAEFAGNGFHTSLPSHCLTASGSLPPFTWLCEKSFSRKSVDWHTQHVARAAFANLRHLWRRSVFLQHRHLCGRYNIHLSVKRRVYNAIVCPVLLWSYMVWLLQEINPVPQRLSGIMQHMNAYHIKSFIRCQHTHIGHSNKHKQE